MGYFNRIFYSSFSANLQHNKIIINLINTSFYYLIAIIFLFSGIVKIINDEELINTLNFFPIFTVDIKIIIASVLPLLEITLGILMILKIKPKITMFAVTILFAIFVAFSIYGLTAGLRADCGCFGNVLKSSFGWGMVLRNIILLVFSIYLLTI